jgi:hypothetical protein
VSFAPLVQRIDPIDREIARSALAKVTGRWGRSTVAEPGEAR